MKKIFNLNNIVLSPFAKSFVYAITSTKFHLMLLLLLILSGCILFYLSTEQFYPEVHKIKIDGSNNDKCFRIDVSASLNCSVIQKEYGEDQYLDLLLFTSADSVSSNQGVALSKYDQKYDDSIVYNYCSNLKATFSGKDIYVSGYPDSIWYLTNDDCLGVAKSRCRELAHSTFEIETISEHKYLSYYSFMGNDIFFNSKSRNPYIAFFLKIDGVGYDDELVGGLSLYYLVNNEKDGREKENNHFEHPINIISSYPSPTIMTPTEVCYDSDAFKYILENGLYFIAEDLSVKKHRERESFFYSMLLGAIITWIIQLIVNIIRKWKEAFEGLSLKKTVRKKARTKKKPSIDLPAK